MTGGTSTGPFRISYELKEDNEASSREVERDIITNNSSELTVSLGATGYNTAGGNSGVLWVYVYLDGGVLNTTKVYTVGMDYSATWTSTYQCRYNLWLYWWYYHSGSSKNTSSTLYQYSNYIRGTNTITGGYSQEVKLNPYTTNYTWSTDGHLFSLKIYPKCESNAYTSNTATSTFKLTKLWITR